jgi:hypothetical protein
MTRTMGAVLLSLAGALACSSPLSFDELAELNDAEDRWESRGFGDYSIETRTSCFCATEVLDWVRIEVVNGQVTRATMLETGEVITDARLQYWTTVEALFDSLRDANDADYLAELNVAFDPTLGFPTQVEWIAPDNVQDAGAVRSMRNARPLD